MVRRNLRNILLVLLLGIGMVALISVFSAVAATNTVSESRADLNSAAIDGNDLKPDACSGINIQNIVDVGAGETGTDANDLILGTAGNDLVIRGGAGDDCILGGGGNEGFIIFLGIFGEEGDDVLIGGPGFDVCQGGGGSNTFVECEVTR